MVIITNFQSPKELDDLEDRFYNGDGFTNLELILEDAAKTGVTEWTVDKTCEPGDIVLFMCAKTSKDHIARVCRLARETEDEDLIKFAEEERNKYRKYAGHIVGLGVLSEPPFISKSDYEFQGWRCPWYGRIEDIRILETPVSIEDFRDFIKISNTGTITKLKDEQWIQLKELMLRMGNNIELK